MDQLQLRNIAHLVAQQNTLNNAELMAAFQALNIDNGEAENWCRLMPVAFARAAYRFSFTGEFPLDIEQQKDKQPLFSDSPVYVAALAYASDCGAMDYLSADVFNGIVRMSPEFTALRSRG